VAGSVTFDVKSVQGDLIKLGYLPKGANDGAWGPGSRRALKRFKRRAATPYRMLSTTNSPADCGLGEVFSELVDEQVTAATLLEIQKWLTKNWRAPIGRFGLSVVSNGKLREDVADAWTKLAGSILAKGGTIEGPYDDTKRGAHKATKVGASSFSFHIVGRAVDLRQKLSDNPGRRYYVAREDLLGKTYWRLYCSVADGAGQKMAKGAVKYWDFVDKKEVSIPASSYLDLTSELAGGGFERIPAQSGWESNYNRTEWWHFQWDADECELIGISTNDLKNAGYSLNDLDRPPG
jgi:hypothetical protein